MARRSSLPASARGDLGNVFAFEPDVRRHRLGLLPLPVPTASFDGEGPCDAEPGSVVVAGGGAASMTGWGSCWEKDEIPGVPADAGVDGRRRSVAQSGGNRPRAISHRRLATRSALFRARATIVAAPTFVRPRTKGPAHRKWRPHFCRRGLNSGTISMANCRSTLKDLPFLGCSRRQLPAGFATGRSLRVVWR